MAAEDAWDAPEEEATPAVGDGGIMGRGGGRGRRAGKGRGRGLKPPKSATDEFDTDNMEIEGSCAKACFASMCNQPIKGKENGATTTPA